MFKSLVRDRGSVFQIAEMVPAPWMEFLGLAVGPHKKQAFGLLYFSNASKGNSPVPTWQAAGLPGGNREE